MQLINTRETYEHEVDMGEGKGKNPVFRLRKLTQHDVDEIDDNSTLTLTDSRKSGEVRYLQGTIRKMKIEAAVVDFVRNIMMGDKEAKFSKETMAMLSPTVRDKLVKHIDEKNELNPDKEKEKDKTKK